MATAEQQAAAPAADIRRPRGLLRQRQPMRHNSLQRPMPRPRSRSARSSSRRSSRRAMVARTVVHGRLPWLT